MKLYLGDCLEIMKQIPDNSIDLVLTDPPYGTTACKWDSVIPFEPMWKELKRICNGTVALFGNEPFSSSLRMSNIKEFKYDWIWLKNCSDGFLQAKKRPMRKSESIHIFGKGKYYPQLDKVDPYKYKRQPSGKRSEIAKVINDAGPMYEIRDFKYPSNIIAFDKPRKRQHPSQKPVALLEYLIKTYTLEGETVLDFTMGSGSTGVACKNLNRNFIGIEKDEKYFEIAKTRLGISSGSN